MEIHRRKGGGFWTKPLDWKLEGVIGPVETTWRKGWHVLLCSSSGIMIAQRNLSGLLPAGITAALFIGPQLVASDAIDRLDHCLTGSAVAYTRRELAGITVTRHKIDVRLSDGHKLRYAAIAHDGLDKHRELLRRTYEPIYREISAGPWWKFRWS